MPRRTVNCVQHRRIDGLSACDGQEREYPFPSTNERQPSILVALGENGTGAEHYTVLIEAKARPNASIANGFVPILLQ